MPRTPNWRWLVKVDASDGQVERTAGQVHALPAAWLPSRIQPGRGAMTRALLAALLGGAVLLVVGAAPLGAQPEELTCAGEPATIVGTGNGATITGTSGPDVIVGTLGADTIYGLQGDDLICGAPDQ